MRPIDADSLEIVFNDMYHNAVRLHWSAEQKAVILVAWDKVREMPTLVNLEDDKK